MCLLRGKSTPAIRAKFVLLYRKLAKILNKKSYPCRCLCFLFAQATLTTPLRFKILHSLHIFLTDDRTFI